MARDIAVIFVHGIFANDPNFAEPMRQALRGMLGSLNFHVDFRSIYWAKTVRDHQQNYMDKAYAAAGISDNKMRRFLIEGLGDAAAYQKTKHRENSIYYEVHDKITAEIKTLDVKGKEDRPLIFIGHSLGCHVISTYIWDMNKLKQRDQAYVAEELDEEKDEDLIRLWKEVNAPTASKFRRLETLAGFVTLGCNIPMFTFTFGPHRVFPITVAPEGFDGRQFLPAFPGAALPQPLKDKARWLNFYSKRDLLGFPLKPLNQYFHDEERIEDIPVESETWLSRWLPYWSGYTAHFGYWTNGIVLERTSELIRNLAA
jgi:hypothetical protein